MIRTVAIAALLAVPFATSVAADSKKQSCEYQAQVVAAIQQARLNKVKERDVAKTVLASNPSWPENYNAAIPLITPWVYEQKKSVIKDQNLSDAWMELCLQQ